MDGGVGELIKHFENDVFGRRKRLLEKCEHFQIIINQFIERMTLDQKNKNKVGVENLAAEHLTSDGTIKMDVTQTEETG